MDGWMDGCSFFMPNQVFLCPKTQSERKKNAEVCGVTRGITTYKETYNTLASNGMISLSLPSLHTHTHTCRHAKTGASRSCVKVEGVV